MSVTRNHHYVPQSYLRNWANENGQVAAYRMAEDQYTPPFWTSPRNICAERDLYANQAMDRSEAETHKTEIRFFAKIDDLGAVAIRELLEHRDFSHIRTRNRFVLFLNAMFHRHPEDVSAIRQKAQQGWREVIDGQRDGIPEHLAQSIDEQKDKVLAEFAEDAESLALNILEKVVLSEKIGQAIVDIPWYIHTIPKSEWTFLTGDRPVVRTRSLVGDAALILMPLAPHALFVATRKDDIIDDLSSISSKEICSLVNTDIVGHCRHYICASSERHSRFISNRR